MLSRVRSSPPLSRDANRAIEPLLGPEVSVSVHENGNERMHRLVNNRNKLKYRKAMKVRSFLFVTLVTAFISCKNADKVQHVTLWGCHLWEWIALVSGAFGGLVVSERLTHFTVFLVELKYSKVNKVVYFVFGLKKVVRICIWSFVLLMNRAVLFWGGVSAQSLAGNRILEVVTLTILSLFLGALLWLLKNILMKTLASAFHANTYFEGIQRLIFSEYVLFTLSGSPTKLPETNNNQFSFRARIKVLINILINARRTTICDALHATIEKPDNENHEDAISKAYHVFRNVAEANHEYINGRDLSRFLSDDDISMAFPSISEGQSGEIVRQALTDWVVDVYKSRKILANRLQDIKTAVKQLNTLCSIMLIVIITVLWLLLTGIATTDIVLVITSHVLVAAFIFGGTCTTTFEDIIFVFLVHPFDIGDVCVVDGVRMKVEEMNIMTTVFLKEDKEKVYFPNKQLAQKQIGNFNRSPNMGDSVEVRIRSMTTLDKINSLKERIRRLLEEKSDHWNGNHDIVVEGNEESGTMKLILSLNHTINFQDFEEKRRRKSDLLLQMRKIMDELKITHFLP